jgi:Flp pilus assembly protein TadB
MDQWEREQERIIKESHELQRNHISLSASQQKKNMQQNWMEVRDKDGNVRYEPLFDDVKYIDASNMYIPEEEHTPVFLVVILVAFYICLALFIGLLVAEYFLMK